MKSEAPYQVDPMRAAEALFNRTFAAAKDAQKGKPASVGGAALLVPGETLRPFQLAGVAHWDNAGRRSMEAWEPGLGKTFAGVAAINKMPHNVRGIVITKDIDRHKWQRVVRKYTKRDAYIYNLDEGAARLWKEDLNGILVVGWSTVNRIADPVVSQNIRVQLTIVDECQKMGNPKAQRTKAARKLLAHATEVMALSGTPALHTPIQLWPILDAMQPGQWGTYWNFCMRYGKPKNTGFGWKFTGASNVKELHEKLKPVIHRVLKSDPDIGMPEKTRVIVPVHPTNLGDYKRLESNKFKEWVDLKGDPREVEMGHLAIVNALRQTATAGKIKQVTEWVRDFLEADPERKFVLFVHHREAASMFIAELSQVGDPWTTLTITGDTPPKKKPLIEEQFQTDPLARLIVCTLDAAGASIELNSATYMGIVEFPWGPEDMVQAEDRIDRLTSKVPSTYYYFVALNTLDEGFVRLLHKKMQDVRGALDGVGSKSSTMFADLVAALDKHIKTHTKAP